MSSCADGNGSLSREELIRALAEVHYTTYGEEPSPRDVKKWRDTFAMTDADKNGELDEQEFAKLVRTFPKILQYFEIPRSAKERRRSKVMFWKKIFKSKDGEKPREISTLTSSVRGDDGEADVEGGDEFEGNEKRKDSLRDMFRGIRGKGKEEKERSGPVLGLLKTNRHSEHDEKDCVNSNIGEEEEEEEEEEEAAEVNDAELSHGHKSASVKEASEEANELDMEKEDKGEKRGLEERERKKGQVGDNNNDGDNRVETHEEQCETQLHGESLSPIPSSSSSSPSASSSAADLPQVTPGRDLSLEFNQLHMYAGPDVDPATSKGTIDTLMRTEMLKIILNSFISCEDKVRNMGKDKGERTE